MSHEGRSVGLRHSKRSSLSITTMSVLCTYRFTFKTVISQRYFRHDARSSETRHSKLAFQHKRKNTRCIKITMKCKDTVFCKARSKLQPSVNEKPVVIYDIEHLRLAVVHVRYARYTRSAVHTIVQRGMYIHTLQAGRNFRKPSVTL
jgi:hypothetical protein